MKLAFQIGNDPLTYVVDVEVEDAPAQNFAELKDYFRNEVHG